MRSVTRLGWLHRIGAVAVIAAFAAFVVRIGASGPQVVSNIGAGSPYTLDGLTWSSGLVPLVGVALTALIPLRFEHLMKWWQWAMIAACWSAVFVGYYSFPLTTSSSNSRIHWVDWRLVPAAQNDLRYFATRIVRSTEWMLSNPWLIGASLTSFSVLMIFVLGHREKWPVAVSLILSCGLIFSGPLGLFINPSEDASTVFAIMISSTVLMTFPRMRPIALVLPTLVRPEFITFWLAFLVLTGMECFTTLRLLRRDRVDSGTSTWQILATGSKRHAPYFVTIFGAGILFLFLQFGLYDALGRRWFMIDGQFIDQSATAAVVPKEIDGWTISAFSGTYIFHFIWMFPTLLILGCILVLEGFLRKRTSDSETFSGRYDGQVNRPINMPLLLLLWCGAILVLHEAKPILYFNTRYLSYAIVAALLASGGIVSKQVCSRNWPRRDALDPRNVAYFSALLAIFLLPTAHSDLREINLDRDYASWALYRDDLVEYGKIWPILSLDHRSATRNSISYYFNVPVGSVRLVVPEDLQGLPKSDAVVVCFDDCDLLWSAGWENGIISGVFLRSG